LRRKASRSDRKRLKRREWRRLSPEKIHFRRTTFIAATNNLGNLKKRCHPQKVGIDIQNSRLPRSTKLTEAPQQTVEFARPGLHLERLPGPHVVPDLQALIENRWVRRFGPQNRATWPQTNLTYHMRSYRRRKKAEQQKIKYEILHPYE